MTKRNFHLAPPDSVSVELYRRSRDVNGNPTARYSIFWDNGLAGADYAGGHYHTKRRVQVGYSDKITGGGLGILSDLFPGARWTVESIREDRGGDSAHFRARRDYDAEPVPVLFRAEKSGDFKGEVTAVFPTICGTGPDDVQTFAHVGQHGTGSRAWYQTTRAATEAEAAPLRRELESAPYHYKLTPAKRWTPRFDEIRREEWKAQRDRARAAAQEGGRANA